MCRNQKRESKHLLVRAEFSNTEENKIAYFIQNKTRNSGFLGVSRTL